MKINGVIIGFDMDKDDSLKPLIQECEYSKPERTERGVISRKDGYMHSAGVEIERITSENSDKAFVTIFLNNPKEADDAVREVMKDLEKVGLV